MMVSCGMLMASLDPTTLGSSKSCSATSRITLRTHIFEFENIFSKYQQDHAGRRLKGMDKNQLEKLVACGAKALKALGGDNGMLRLVEEFTFHWQLRDACDHGLLMEWENPQSNTVYLEEDDLETNSKSTENVQYK